MPIGDQDPTDRGPAWSPTTDQVAAGARPFCLLERIRAGRMAPSWSEVEPGDIKSLLPYLMVPEVLVHPFDVRYRIVGTAVVEAFRYDFTWKTLRSLERGSDTTLWLGVCRDFVERRGPCFG